MAPVLDPDAVARSIRDALLPQDDSNIEAGRRVLLEADRLLKARESFTVETTLSGNTYLRLTAQAKVEGFLVVVVFVVTAAVEINIERVRIRVLKGGHDVPEADQRRRYPRTLANMRKLMPMADFLVILDNSTSRYEVVAFGHKQYMHWNEPVPVWATQLRADRPSTA